MASALHPLDGALLVSARAAPQANGDRQLYLARGDELVAQPVHTIRGEFSNDRLAIVGQWPHRVFAIAGGSSSGRYTSRILRRKASGWITIGESDEPHTVRWWSGRLMALVRDVTDRNRSRLISLKPAGTELALPEGRGPLCDSFYAGNASGFPQLEVLPQGLATVADRLYVLGIGCDGKFAAVSWGTVLAPPRIHTGLDVQLFLGSQAGVLVGRSSTDLWFLPPTRSAAGYAALGHFDGAAWRNVPMPREAPSADDIAVDEDGSLWATSGGKLYRRAREKWSEEPLPGPCEARAVAVAEPHSVWVACAECVLRVSKRLRQRPDPDRVEAPQLVR